MDKMQMVTFDRHGIIEVVDDSLLQAVAAGVVAGVRDDTSTYANDQCASNYNNGTCFSANGVCASDVACAEII